MHKKKKIEEEDEVTPPETAVEDTEGTESLRPPAIRAKINRPNSVAKVASNETTRETTRNERNEVTSPRTSVEVKEGKESLRPPAIRAK